MLEDECIVGALSLVQADVKFPRRSLVVGNPARIIKTVSDEMIRWKADGTKLYQTLPGEMRNSWRACEPLSQVPEDRPKQEQLYDTWNSIKSNR